MCTTWSASPASSATTGEGYHVSAGNSSFVFLKFDDGVSVKII
jgi:hypothetical protein